MVNFTFDNLNSYVNYCLWDLHEYETKFFNQLISSVEDERNVEINRKKFNYLNGRCNSLREQQENVDLILEHVLFTVNQMECLLMHFERSNGRDLELATTDCFRAKFYGLTEKIAIAIHNSNEMLEFVGNKTQQAVMDTNDPINSVFKIVRNCYELLDKLYVHTLKLQNAVDGTERVMKYTMNTCNCT